VTPTTTPTLPTWRELIELEEKVREILRARMRRAATTARTPGDEEWHRLSPFERFEWLEEHCWILPPEERWDAMERSRAKIVGLIKGAPSIWPLTR
jgi:hypothetical protein